MDRISRLDIPAIHSKNTHASPTPIVHDDAIFVHFGAMGLAAPVWVTGASKRSFKTLSICQNIVIWRRSIASQDHEHLCSPEHFDAPGGIEDHHAEKPVHGVV